MRKAGWPDRPDPTAVQRATLVAMCGRFALFVGPEDLAKHFGVTIEDMEIEPRYNISPTQDVPTIRNRSDDGREVARVHWGLIPFWAKDAKIGNRMINARANTAPEKPAFRAALKSRRCLIPASGFYEWRATGGTNKQPYYVHAKDGAPLAFAGLWERWRPNENEAPVESCAILTTDANATMAPIHDRMPVVLEPADYAMWLGEVQASADEPRALLRPAPNDRLVAEPVSTAVNSPRHDMPDCVTPLNSRQP